MMVVGQLIRVWLKFLLVISLSAQSVQFMQAQKIILVMSGLKGRQRHIFQRIAKLAPQSVPTLSLLDTFLK